MIEEYIKHLYEKKMYDLQIQSLIFNVGLTKDEAIIVVNRRYGVRSNSA